MGRGLPPVKGFWEGSGAKGVSLSIPELPSSSTNPYFNEAPPLQNCWVAGRQRGWVDLCESMRAGVGLRLPSPWGPSPELRSLQLSKPVSLPRSGARSGNPKVGVQPGPFKVKEHQEINTPAWFGREVDSVIKVLHPAPVQPSCEQHAWTGALLGGDEREGGLVGHQEERRHPQVSGPAAARPEAGDPHPGEARGSLRWVGVVRGARQVRCG